MPQPRPDRAANRTETVITHSEFYFDDDLVVIQIENILFRVHKYQLVKSEVFSDMFSTANADPQEGSSHENPIVLQNVSAIDFGCLLRVLYASHFSTHHPAPEASLIVPAFRLANMWNFRDLREHLLPLVENEIDPVEKIVFAREFDISSWLAPAHMKLCERQGPITTAEALKLGTHSLLMIYRMREELTRTAIPPGRSWCGTCAGCTIYAGSRYVCENCTALGNVIRHTPGPPYRTVSKDSVLRKLEKWVDDGCVLADE